LSCGKSLGYLGAGISHQNLDARIPQTCPLSFTSQLEQHWLHPRCWYPCAGLEKIILARPWGIFYSFYFSIPIICKRGNGLWGPKVSSLCQPAPRHDEFLSDQHCLTEL
jgi:hypothetical protein